MPTYEYRCENCNHQFEEFQSISADPIEVCPLCNGHVKRLIGAGNGFLFKGSGFYITDYRSSSYKQDKAKEEKGSSTSSSQKKTTAKKTEASNVA